MGLRGMLTRERFGFSVPCDAPLYPAPPYLYEGATMLAFDYLTDPKTAVELLPAVDGLELTDPPHAGLVFARYPKSTLGPYDELVLYLNATFQGKEVRYGAYLYVTTDAAMAAGREMGGFPKKIAVITFEAGATYRATLERPAGQLLASATLTPGESSTPVQKLALEYMTLRVIPSPVRGAPPSLTELVDSTWEMSEATVRPALGTLSLTGVSESDPLQKAPVVELKTCTLLQGALRVDLSDRPTIPLA
ncbi:MAG: acetoacetate decarboxylase family protein [Isosphaeraceae bacterium]